MINVKVTNRNFVFKMHVVLRPITTKNCNNVDGDDNSQVIQMSDNKEEMEHNTVPEISSNEFRKILINWFENQGITTELRTHLRHQMVLTLQNTQLGRKLSNVYSRLTPKTEFRNTRRKYITSEFEINDT
ncbi:hypothetical protein CBL_02022 [Carabus blaptoides fortunei]